MKEKNILLIFCKSFINKKTIIYKKNKIIKNIIKKKVY